MSLNTGFSLFSLIRLFMSFAYCIIGQSNDLAYFDKIYGPITLPKHSNNLLKGPGN